MSSTVSRPDPEVFADVLDDAVVVILNHEDPVRFFDWFERRLADSKARRQCDLGGDDDIEAFAHTFGRALWNAMPLPGNDFRPKPLPAPGRNDACPCGSGRKFKRCCGNGPQPAGLDSQALWPLVALNLLCNLYDELGYRNKKTVLLARIVSETRRSPLRSGALQRRATIKMDAGDPAGRCSSG